MGAVVGYHYHMVGATITTWWVLPLPHDGCYHYYMVSVMEHPFRTPWGVKLTHPYEHPQKVL